MNLTELVFREVNVVLVHTGIAVQAVSLDRVRSARSTSNLQVTSTPNVLTLVYPDDRATVQIDPQRITATDSSGMGPAAASVVELALAQHTAVGGPRGSAFGYNFRFDFSVEGMPSPGEHLIKSTVYDQEAISTALHAESIQIGMKLVFGRVPKIWMLMIEPMPGDPHRVAVHANVHEGLTWPSDQTSDSLPAPAWMEGVGLGSVDAGFPSSATMKADFMAQSNAALECVAALLSLQR